MLERYIFGYAGKYQLISDLPHHKCKAWQEMKRLNLADYPQKQLEDFTRYVFGIHYTSIAETLQKGRENL